MSVASELTGFAAAVEKRFGRAGERAMLRAQQPGAKPFEGGPSIAPEQREVVAEVGRVFSTVKAAESAAEKQIEAERLSLRVSQGARLRP